MARFPYFPRGTQVRVVDDGGYGGWNGMIATIEEIEPEDYDGNLPYLVEGVNGGVQWVAAVEGVNATEGVGTIKVPVDEFSEWLHRNGVTFKAGIELVALLNKHNVEVS